MSSIIHTFVNMKRKKKQISTNDSLMLRVAQAKAKLPNAGKGYHYGIIMEHEFGAMTENEMKLLHAVWNLRAVDAGMTNKIEKLIEIIT